MFRKTWITGLLFFICTSYLWGFDQNPEFEYIDTLIKNQKYEIASQKIGEILSKSPENPDALMYKGVLIFYSESISSIKKGIWQNIDSIYEPNFRENDLENAIISKETANKISAIFLKALEKEPGKMNVQLALCYVYAKAGMKSELISRFPELKKFSTAQDKMQYNMAEYARIISKQKSIDEAIEVYREINKLYPEDGNIYNDMGLLFYENGNLENSLELFRKAQETGNLDKSTLENLLLVYSLTGDYDKLQKTANILSAEEKDKTDIIYQALLQRIQNKPDWYNTLTRYSNPNNSKKEINSFVNALQKSLVTNNYNNFIETTRYNVPAPMLALNYEWALRNYPDKFINLYNYADFLTYYHHYSRAIEIYKNILNQKLPTNKNQDEEFSFSYAWALYKSGRNLQSLQHWKKLVNSSNFYKKSAASYFLGKYFLEKKDFAQANKYFSLVKDKPDASKYALFCLGLYNTMAEQGVLDNP